MCGELTDEEFVELSDAKTSGRKYCYAPSLPRGYSLLTVFLHLARSISFTCLLPGLKQTKEKKGRSNSSYKRKAFELRRFSDGEQ